MTDIYVLIQENDEYDFIVTDSFDRAYEIADYLSILLRKDIRLYCRIDSIHVKIGGVITNVDISDIQWN